MKNQPSKIITEDVVDIVKRVENPIKKLEDSSILITGASGLYGSYFLDVIAYLNDNIFSKKCKVVAIQRSNPSKIVKLRYLLNRSDIEFVKHDARFSYETKRKFDYLVHSAGMSAPASFQSDPLGTIDVNVNGIRWLLDFAKKNKSKSVLYMSSGETYGKPSMKDIPIKEEFNGNVSTMDSRACYAESKRLAETLCSVYFKQFGVPVKIARAFATYGPGITVSDKRVIADFIRSGLEGKPIQMMSNGSDTRVFCYITDAMVAFLKILLSDQNGEVFNVSSDLDEVKIIELARIVHKLCGIKETVKIKTSTKADFLKDAPVVIKPDISKIRRVLKFEPKVTIEVGVKRTILWNKEIMNI